MMDTPDKRQPSLERLTVQESADIFRYVLALVLTEESPFARAPFVSQIAENYLLDPSQLRYFTSEEGFGANIVIINGVAQPSISLNITEGLQSRHLRKRVAIRLGKHDPSDEEIFRFAVGHELGHLIQGLANYTRLESQDLAGLTEAGLNELIRRIEEYNNSINSNADIVEAQEFFRSVFRDDIARDDSESCLDVYQYQDQEYIRYVNSRTEANADFIALWIMGMAFPDMKSAPQNEGYQLADWLRWADDHQISVSQLTI